MAFWDTRARASLLPKIATEKLHSSFHLHSLQKKLTRFCESGMDAEAVHPDDGSESGGYLSFIWDLHRKKGRSSKLPISAFCPQHSLAIDFDNLQTNEQFRSKKETDTELGLIAKKMLDWSINWDRVYQTTGRGDKYSDLVFRFPRINPKIMLKAGDL